MGYFPAFLQFNFILKIQKSDYNFKGLSPLEKLLMIWMESNLKNQ